MKLGEWIVGIISLGLLVFYFYLRWIDSSILYQYFINPFPTAASITYAVVFFFGGLYSIKRWLFSDEIDERILGLIFTPLLFFGCGFMLWNLKY